MDQQGFQKEVIDRLARIETKHDSTTVRIGKLESDVECLKEYRAESRGAHRLITAGSGLVGAVIGSAAHYFFQR